MERLQKFRRNWPFMALLIFYLYLAFHALSGNQGLVSWVDYENDITHYQAALEAVKAERRDLESQTDALRASQLDIDALDIKARQQVFLTKPDEVTIWLDPTP